MKKRRLLSIVLSLCMVLALMPQMVFAEEPTGTPLTKKDVTSGGTLQLENGQRYYLSEDIDITRPINIDGSVTLDLNGYKISMTSKDSVIKVENSGELTLQDNSEGKTGMITGGHTLSSGGGVFVSSGSFVMEGGKIYDCSASNRGGGVYIIFGSFTMKGGIIYDCYAADGGSVATDGGIFTMEGGIIDSGNEFVSNDIIVDANSTFNANGGVVKSFVNSKGQINNTAPYGGTIFYGDSNRFGNIIEKKVIFEKDNSTYATEIVANGSNAAEPEAPTKEGCEFAGWYNGDTEYDFNQPVTDNVTLKALWVSPELIIKGLEDGKTYCDTVQFEVSTKPGSRIIVKANGVILTADANGKYSLEKGSGKVDIDARDDMGNQKSVSVTVNNGHTGGTATCTQKAKCGICGEEYGELANHSLSKTDAKDATCTENGNSEYWTCTVCKKMFSDENGTNETTQDAVTIRAAGHTLNKTDAKEATAAETGNIEYWQCENCKGCFSDKDGKNSIKLADTVTKKLPPEIIEGKDQTVTAGEKKALTFCSNALFDDFKRVDLDGSELSEEYYEKAEGSIIITLDADYVATLPVGEHTIGIVSESGTAETTFVVKEKAAPGTSDDSDKDSKADAEDSAKTGDDTNLVLWLALMLLSGAGITGVTAYTRRKRTNE